MNLTNAMLVKVEEYQAETFEEMDELNADGETIGAEKLAREYRRLTTIRCYLEDRADR